VKFKVKFKLKLIGNYIRNSNLILCLNLNLIWLENE